MTTASGTTLTSLRLSPTRLILLIAAACLGIGLWGAFTGNWVLAASEAPSVVGLLIVAALARTLSTGSALTKATAVVGLICLVEIAIAVLIVDARGLQLALIVVVTTGLTIVAGVVYWLRYIAGRQS
ncbi:MAG: hypothetical protein ACR2OD_13255 [Gaiellaceae bacterium]